MTKDEVIEWIKNVPEDEPVFVLRARDDCSVHAISEWLHIARVWGSPKEKLDGVLKFADEFFVWRENNKDRCKIPD